MADQITLAVLSASRAIQSGAASSRRMILM
jgi:hypothetical protein